MIWELAGGFNGIFRLVAGAVLAWAAFSVWNTAVHDPAVTKAARAEYVAMAVYEAEQAKRIEAERQVQVGAIAFEEYRKKLAAVQLADKADDARHEAEIAEMERRVRAAGTQWLLDESDKEFLER